MWGGEGHTRLRNGEEALKGTAFAVASRFLVPQHMRGECWMDCAHQVKMPFGSEESLITFHNPFTHRQSQTSVSRKQARWLGLSRNQMKSTG